MSLANSVSLIAKPTSGCRVASRMTNSRIYIYLYRLRVATLLLLISSAALIEISCFGISFIKRAASVCLHVALVCFVKRRNMVKVFGTQRYAYSADCAVSGCPSVTPSDAPIFYQASSSAVCRGAAWCLVSLYKNNNSWGFLYYCYLRLVYSDTTQLNSTSSWVELCRCKRAFRLQICYCVTLSSA